MQTNFTETIFHLLRLCMKVVTGPGVKSNMKKYYLGINLLETNVETGREEEASETDQNGATVKNN